MMDLDELLYGTPDWNDVVEYFKNGEFYEEHYEVEAIEKFILTEAQRQWLFDNKLSIEKMLNGRYGTPHEQGIHTIYGEWNAKLGFKRYGS